MSGEKPMKVCVAGTFNRIHKGHITLLTTAFEVGDEVFIGLTSDEMAKSGRSVPVLDYGSREKNLTEAAAELSCGKPFRIVKIQDEIGPAAFEEYDAIVVSSQTLVTAKEINEARASNGLYPLDIIEIEMVLADDGTPISATRIIQNEDSE
jgi:pantetheine-phosphate adenylyltransferase